MRTDAVADHPCEQVGAAQGQQRAQDHSAETGTCKFAQRSRCPEETPWLTTRRGLAKLLHFRLLVGAANPALAAFLARPRLAAQQAH